MQNRNRANAPRFRTGPILTGGPNRYSTIETMTTISEAESGQRSQPFTVKDATLATYLSTTIAAKKTGRGAKITTPLPDASLFDAVSPQERDKIIMSQIRDAKVPPHIVDNAKSAIEFALRAKPVDGNTKPYGLIKVVAKRYANHVKRDLGFPVTVTSEAYQELSSKPISAVSIDDLFGPESEDRASENPEMMTVFNPAPANTDPMLSKFTAEELSRLLLLANEIGPRYRSFVSHLLRGESPARAGELCGIDETVSRQQIRRIREVMKKHA